MTQPIREPVTAASLRPAGGRLSVFRRTRWAGYALAIGCVALALVFTVLGERFLAKTIFLLFIAATTVTAWFAGRGPALLTVLLSLVAVETVFLAPRFSVALERAVDVAPLVGFLGIGTLIIWMSGVARRREVLLERQASQLQEHATELEAQIANSQNLQAELEESNEAMADINAELARQRELLEEAQRSASIGSWDWDIPLNRVTWSDEMYRVYGLDPHSVAVDFELFLRHVHPDDQAMVQERIRQSVATHEPFAFEHRIVRADGTVRWLDARGKVQVRHGKPIRMSGSGQDITERRRTTESMRVLADAYEALSSSLDYEASLAAVANMCVGALADWCTIAMGDETGRYENVVVAHRNPERLRWAEEYSRLHPPRYDVATGVPQVLRTGKSEFYPEISRQALLAAGTTPEELRVIDELGLQSAIIAPMIARGRTIGAITFIAAESGHRFGREDLWLAERLAGRAASTIDNARLYREAQAARAEAEDANRVKMDFLAAMSHELRTPLNAIAGYAQLLEMELHGELNGQQRELLGRLQRSQRHLLTLVEQVLSFARLEAGRLNIHAEPVSVGQAVASAIELLTPQMEARRLRYEYEDGNGSLAVRADSDRLQQILVNLLSNAVKFTPEGGRVRVAAQRSGDQVAIRVTDTGVGIPADQLERVFEPFVQLPQPTEKRAAGVGLGLAISRDLARAMGGDIHAERAPEGGAAFVVHLPRAQG